MLTVKKTDDKINECVNWKWTLDDIKIMWAKCPHNL
jgi:hypothetical protein